MNEFIKNMRVPDPDSLFGKLWEIVNFEIALKFAVLYVFIIWIATVVWVIKDITNRSGSVLGQIFCILLVVLLPFIGIFLYLLIRPSNTLLEKYYSEIEENLDIVSEFIKQHISDTDIPKHLDEFKSDKKDDTKKLKKKKKKKISDSEKNKH